MKRTAVWVMAVALVLASASVADWPQWRGEKGLGTSDAKNLPVKWSANDVLWKVDLPGQSAATPALAGDRLFLSSPDGSDVYLICVSTEGKVLWKRKVGTGNRQLGWNSKNNFATPSPTTDGKHVWLLVGSGDLACFDVDGNPVWARNLTKDHGPITSDFGIGCTPLVHRDRIIFPCIHRRAESYVLAVDKVTGKDIWKTMRPTPAEEESRDAYSSPAVYEYPDGRAEVILCAADLVTAYDFQSGKEVWRHGDINPSGNQTLRIIVSPVTTPDLIYVTSAKRGPVYAIKPGGAGDVTKTHRVWTMLQHTPDVATPAIHNGLLYMVQERGVVSCLDAKTGKPHWQERVGPGYFPASPVVADGKIYVTNEEGFVHVLAEGPKYQLLAKNDLGDTILATPVPADGRLYFRTAKHLLCIGRPASARGS